MFVKINTIVLILLIISGAEVFSQKMGFGCLGLVGGYGGYSYQQYKPTGLNNYIEDFNTAKADSLSGPLQKFGKAQGFRVGMNLFRVNIEGVILTAKGYYQELSEKTNSQIDHPTGISRTTMDMKWRTFGAGIDLGLDITKRLDWKIIDAAVNFNNVIFNLTQDYPDAQSVYNSYQIEGSRIGYSVGTGFIYNLIDQYISIEGTASYTFASVGRMKNGEIYLTETESSPVPMEKFIEAGGFNAVLQLNIGFPL